MNAKTAAIQGSGWGWLGCNKATGKLEVVTTPNQDPLLCASSISFKAECTLISGRVAHVPIIGIDIWEHAFYLQYKNVKPDVSVSLLAAKFCFDAFVFLSTSTPFGMSSTSRRPRSDIMLAAQPKGINS